MFKLVVALTIATILLAGCFAAIISLNANLSIIFTIYIIGIVTTLIYVVFVIFILISIKLCSFVFLSM